MATSRFGRTTRRRFVASSALGGAAILTAGKVLPAGQQASAPVVLAQDSSADVPMFRGNAVRTGEMPGPGPDDANGVEVIWSFATGDEVNTSPAVAGGVVYVGSSDGNLYAVSAGDGTELWRFATGGRIESSPAVVDGMVYIGASFGGTKGALSAVNADDGTERWRFDTGSGITESSPAVVDGVVYVGDALGTLYAVSTTDGTEHWRFVVANDRKAYPYLLSSPAILDGAVFFGAGNGNLYAVNADDGTERWRFAAGDRIWSSPAVADGVVYFGSPGGYLYAVSVADGAERWKREFAAESDNGRAAPAVVDGNVYFACDEGNLYAVNAEDGVERWRFRTGEWSSPTVVDDVIYVADYGHLCAASAVDGTELWSWGTGRSDDMRSSPVVLDGVVYVGSADGNLYAIGAQIPPLRAGGTARVTESTFLRGGPSPTAVERVKLQLDTAVMITGEAETTDDATWWPVTVDATGDQGWVEASKLEPLTIGPEPTATP